MKEENLFRRRFSLCPATSTPQKVNPKKLMRNLSFGGDNDLYPLSPGSEIERNGLPELNDELSPTQASTPKGGEWPSPVLMEAESPPSQKMKLDLPLHLIKDFQSEKMESKLLNGHEKECTSPMDKLAKKESLKVQKKNYREEKKRAAKELFSALKDPTVIIMANWLKIRGTLKSWTKLWCVLKPGVLLIYKTPKVDHWVGTILLSACKLIERPSKKDGFCFKLYHPMDKSIWTMKGPKGENVGSITQPLPSSYLIFRAVSESDGRCWMDALELALSCSSLYKLSSSKQVKDVDLNCSSDSSHILNLLQSSNLSDQELFQLNESTLRNHHMENDTCSDKSERETHEESENGTTEKSRRLTEESDTDQSEIQTDLSPDVVSTIYHEQMEEEMAPAGETSQTETVSEENKGLIWTLLKQLRPGMDLSRVVLPTFILEPRSFLDKLSDYYYHANFLSEAALEQDAYCRMKHVLKWYLSGFYKKPKGLKKPYNPILGETFRCRWFHPQTNSCTFYIAEQVSHHPPVSAFYVSNQKDGFCISGSILAKSKYYGNSLSAVLDGTAKLLFLNLEEEYVITMPYAHCKGILYGKLTMELGGKVTIVCEKTKYNTELEFKLKPLFGGYNSVNQISGTISLGDEVMATVEGHWDGEVFLDQKMNDHKDLFWSPTSEVRMQRLRRQVVQFGQQGEFESERLWQHVTSAIKEKDQLKATQEKYILEEAQRQAARERKDQQWHPRLFQFDPITNEWHYKYANTSPWDPQKYLTQFEKDGIIDFLERHPKQSGSAAYSKNQMVMKKMGMECKRRKTSSQPSSYSQNTESSSSTPEPTQESSDNDDCTKQCTKCLKEKKDVADLETAIASIQRTQNEIQSNLCALSRQICQGNNLWDKLHLNNRYWIIFSLLLLFQLFINYVFK